MSKEQHEKIKEFMNDTDITVRKADKGNVLVLLKTSDYLLKMDSLVSDANELQNLTRNPTEYLK